GAPAHRGALRLRLHEAAQRQIRPPAGNHRRRVLPQRQVRRRPRILHTRAEPPTRRAHRRAGEPARLLLHGPLKSKKRPRSPRGSRREVGRGDCRWSVSLLRYTDDPGTALGCHCLRAIVTLSRPCSPTTLSHRRTRTPMTEARRTTRYDRVKEI